MIFRRRLASPDGAMRARDSITTLCRESPDPGHSRGSRNPVLCGLTWATRLSFASDTPPSYNSSFGLSVRGLAVGWRMS
jgi:hypothetical protein